MTPEQIAEVVKRLQEGNWPYIDLGLHDVEMWPSLVADVLRFTAEVAPSDADEMLSLIGDASAVLKDYWFWSAPDVDEGWDEGNNDDVIEISKRIDAFLTRKGEPPPPH